MQLLVNLCTSIVIYFLNTVNEFKVSFLEKMGRKVDRRVNKRMDYSRIMSFRGEPALVLAPSITIREQ